MDDIFVTSKIKKQLYSEYSSLIHKIDIDYKDINTIRYKIYFAGDWEKDKIYDKFLDGSQPSWADIASKYEFINSKFQESISTQCLLLQEELLTNKFKEKLLKDYVLLSKDVDKFIFISHKPNDSSYSKIKSRYTKVLNAGLIDSVRQKTAKSVSKNEVEETTIIGMMIGKKIKKDTRAYILLFTGLVIYLLLGLFTAQPNLLGLMFFALAILALQTNQKVTEYRIRKGFYGTNYYEAREIIQFVVENSDENFYSGGKIKKLMPEPEVLQEEARCVEGGVFA
ncbi:MAG: hypothetical protein LC128_06045 [Chitinophagales bacterium]|nr:hypothetical protein [Chitinophagales bacterium]